MIAIGFDFDATLVKSDLVLCDIMTDYVGYPILPENITAYDPRCAAPELTKNDVKIIIDRLIDMEHTLQIPAYPGALEFLRWYGKENEINIITNREYLEPVSVYLQRNLDQETFSKVSLFNTSKKGRLARALNLTHFVDDHIENIVDLANHGIIPMLYRQNWNEHKISKKSHLYNLVHFVDSWNDIHEFVKYSF